MGKERGFLGGRAPVPPPVIPGRQACPPVPVAVAASAPQGAAVRPVGVVSLGSDRMAQLQAQGVAVRQAEAVAAAAKCTAIAAEARAAAARRRQMAAMQSLLGLGGDDADADDVDGDDDADGDAPQVAHGGDAAFSDADADAVEANAMDAAEVHVQAMWAGPPHETVQAFEATVERVGVAPSSDEVLYRAAARAHDAADMPTPLSTTLFGAGLVTDNVIPEYKWLELREKVRGPIQCSPCVGCCSPAMYSMIVGLILKS